MFPTTICIKKITQETPLVRSYVFEFPRRALPGQFINVWLPGVDEKPMSVADDDGTHITISVAAVGEFSKALAQTKEGDMIGIRGPFGKPFTWKPKQRIAMLAGGYGVAPLYFTTEKALLDDCIIDFYHGARSGEHLLFAPRVKKLKNTTYYASTDDGSEGFHGNNVSLWKQKMDEGIVYDLVMSCGPERMMKAVSDECAGRNISAQVSVERYMKCGFGVCGNCTVDELGITSCQNGTVMDNEVAQKIKEFGVYHRDSVGRKINF